ncbi:MAG: bifunctional oligoribonuclease and phosphatase NrnA [Clostridiales bacterium]|jgi:phosphoesterase RecJ-like protein|nr:bifunctional oligoribonuclease and phosphatase NrnA [Clostridiales bacterium]MDN5281684.1 bifunctional oligoribonuclease and phosphatase NrnA [Candidatus Ozemobacter sp.]
MHFKWPSEDYDQQAELIAQQLKQAKNVFCIAHPFSDGDALGSQLALYHFCKATGKNCYCLNFEPLPEQLSWLEGSEFLTDTLPEDMDFDLGFLMETTEARRMGDRVAFFERAKVTIHLDHHVNVTGLGKENLIDDKASSTCEILYNILEKTGVELNLQCCEALYVGIMTDTGNFRYNNSTPRAHEIVARLIEKGLVVDEIFKKVYETTNYNRVVIHGTAMSRTARHCNGKLVTSWLSLDDFIRTGSKEVDSDGCIRNISVIKGIEVAILFKEVEGGKVKISFRSTGKVDVMEISRRFNGGGHRLAAGAQVEGNLDSVMREVIEMVSQTIEQGDY